MNQGTGRYAAFLSYSHKDAAAARWLHRRLETYRIPRRLVGSAGEHGPVPARLTPIFRDREELPAAGDLSERVRAALAESGHLVVICSPHSAASPWVAREIEVFRELHPDRPVYAAIVEGDPEQCFPRGLAAAGVEPLAADLRAGRDGRRLGFLKLVAGLAGTPLDALVQRDAQRRMRRVTAVTAAALAAVLIMAVLTAMALNARAEAQRQRAEVEDIVEFMLTDLRTRLKGVRRLDVSQAVNERVLRHYASQDLADLPADSLERRARLLQQIGEDDLDRGQPGRALAQFREAARTTAALLADRPDDPDRIFAQSQSEYWVGKVDYIRNNFAAARAAFERYRALAERLVAIDSSKAEWVKEAGYAAGSLCSTALARPQDPAAALRLCTVALQRMERVQQLTGTTRATVEAVLNRHLWMMKAWNANGRWDRVLYHKARQEELMGALLRADPENVDYRDIWMQAQFGIAEILLDHGDTAEARTRLADAAATVAKLRVHDSNNAEWRAWATRIEALSKKGDGR
ncbi:MAG TPA: toll/interleukin-1 receptor domain-containing protein [Allosphingosinicella sp.]